MGPTSLPEAIQNLPQELQDSILELALIGNWEDSCEQWPLVVKIDDTYRLPWQLSVNRASRRKVAEHYYSRTAFDTCLTFTEVGTLMLLLCTLSKWLAALPITHLREIKELRITLALQTEASTRALQGFGALMVDLAGLTGRAHVLESLQDYLQRAKLDVAPESLKARWTPRGEVGDQIVDFWLSQGEIESILSEVRGALPMSGLQI
ncbi:hypothetical protein Slin14017_G067000 [Septoria linicola]|nr:hypothetical protein Slin14017_G067000 [Septoria linicola]